MQKRLVTRYASHSAEAADENQRRVEAVLTNWPPPSLTTSAT